MRSKYMRRTESPLFRAKTRRRREGRREAKNLYGNYKMLNNLLEFIDNLEYTPEFDLDGRIDLVKVEKKANKLELKYLIYTGIDNKPPFIWKIVCNEVREYKTIFGEQCSNFELYQDHVLLWSYHQPKLSLTFSSNSCNVDVNSVV